MVASGIEGPLVRRVAGLAAVVMLHAASLTAPASVAAQSTEEPKVELPPVVVVGTSLQRTPVTATTVSSKLLSERGIESALQLWYVVPNLSQINAGLRSFSDNYSIRGVGNTEFLSDPAVVLYVDGAPFD